MQVFIHIGTHKTGTTSLQACLRTWSPELAASGLLVPSAGTLSATSGHHNLAFQLAGDSRYDPALGGLSELVAELRLASNLPHPRRAVISSEDFCCLVEKPDGLHRLESTLRREGHTVTWVMFLRRADDYSESLYTTLWGCGVRPRFGYPGFVLSILAKGKYAQTQRFGGSVHYFDFAAFTRRWRQLSASRLLLRDYDQAVATQGVLTCFLSILGAPEALIATASCDQPRLNSRMEHITRRYRRVLRPLLMARFQRRHRRVING
ncbi:hypothetical protein VB738_06815 [Cyanobium gracile UHCC 0139]|uniref:Sulfotransferase family protein n=1 Tax=Cyanobium gracile UHCC 0139 TaxID=3110308 RepID=A0ABU5RTA1_9CYAN|nr:hypothetical protein [Cyanobium gracile]MEA5390971.1 hypothetical protein [Cyanobium gracile UHCC 0139]